MSDGADRRPAELDASDPEPVGADIVAASRALERAAARILESAGLDRRSQLEIRSACEQLAADRTNGEALDGSMDRLRALVARYGQHPDPASRRDDGGAGAGGPDVSA